MKKVFRIRTIYHLLYAIVLVDQKDDNTLVLHPNSNILKVLPDTQILKKYFQHIKITKNRPKHKDIRRFFVRQYVCFIRPFTVKDTIMITTFHPTDVDDIPYLKRTREMHVIEDGFHSYMEKSSMYQKVDKSWKSPRKTIHDIIHKPFIHITNHSITKYYFADPTLLSIKLPAVYELIKDKVIELDVKKEIKDLNNDKEMFIFELFPEVKHISITSVKTLLLITQPNCDIHVYQDAILPYYKEYDLYIKIHPKEDLEKYSDLPFTIKGILSGFPLELLELLGIRFTIGVTYNSTAINTDIFNKKIIIKPLFRTREKTGTEPNMDI